MQVQPYLVFEGRCEEALEFYKQAVGAKVEMMMRNKESPDQPPPEQRKPGQENKILHSSVRVGETEFFATDGHNSGEAKFQGFMLSLTVATPADAERYFQALVDGGQVLLPITKTFFSPSFGMLTDRFGVSWMVYVKQAT